MSLLYKNCISSIENYNNTLKEDYIKVINRYNKLITEYLKHCYDNMLIQNEEYKKYIVYQGISTITHVFKMLLVYTKNIELTYFNCQKAFVYYIEFIGQITEDNHSFLQLNSKDATLFVYKKTIFEINNDVKKNYKSDEDTKKILVKTDILIEIYNEIINKILSNNYLSDIIKIVNVDFQKILQKIIKSYMEVNDIQILKKILNFVINLKEKNLLENLELFIKKLKKKDNINNININLQIINHQNEKNIIPNEFITNIFNK